MNAPLTDVPALCRHDCDRTPMNLSGPDSDRYVLACTCGQWTTAHATRSAIGPLFDQHLADAFPHLTASTCATCERLIFQLPHRRQWVHAALLAPITHDATPTPTPLQVVYDRSTDLPLTTPATPAAAHVRHRQLLTELYRGWDAKETPIDVVPYTPDLPGYRPPTTTPPAQSARPPASMSSVAVHTAPTPDARLVTPSHPAPLALMLAYPFHYTKPVEDNPTARARALFCGPNTVVRQHPLAIPTGTDPDEYDSAVLLWTTESKHHPGNRVATALLHEFGAPHDRPLPVENVAGIALIVGARPGSQQAHELSTEALERVLAVIETLLA